MKTTKLIMVKQGSMAVEIQTDETPRTLVAAIFYSDAKGRLTKAEAEEYGKLFAAAPELLEACKEALKALRIIYEHTDDEDVCSRLDCWPLTEIRNAITKAETA